MTSGFPVCMVSLLFLHHRLILVRALSVSTVYPSRKISDDQFLIQRRCFQPFLISDATLQQSPARELHKTSLGLPLID